MESPTGGRFHRPSGASFHLRSCSRVERAKRVQPLATIPRPSGAQDTLILSVCPFRYFPFPFVFFDPFLAGADLLAAGFFTTVTGGGSAPVSCTLSASTSFLGATAR